MYVLELETTEGKLHTGYGRTGVAQSIQELRGRGEGAFALSAHNVPQSPGESFGVHPGAFEAIERWSDLTPPVSLEVVGLALSLASDDLLHQGEKFQALQRLHLRDLGELGEEEVGYLCQGPLVERLHDLALCGRSLSRDALSILLAREAPNLRSLELSFAVDSPVLESSPPLLEGLRSLTLGGASLTEALLGMWEGGAVLKELERLTLGSALGAEGSGATIFAMLGQHAPASLTSLELQGAYIDEERARALTTGALQGLERLSIPDAGLEAGALAILVESFTSLRVLDLRRASLSPELVDEVFGGGELLPIELLLYEGHDDRETLRAFARSSRLAEGVREQFTRAHWQIEPSVESWRMRRTDGPPPEALDEEGFADLRQALHSSPSVESWERVCDSIERLVSAGRAIGPEEEWMVYCLSALERWPSALRLAPQEWKHDLASARADQLEKLRIVANLNMPAHGDKGLKVIARHEQFANLRGLGLRGCGVTKFGIKALLRAEHLQHVTRLELGGNAKIGATGLKELFDKGAQCFPELAMLGLREARLGKSGNSALLRSELLAGLEELDLRQSDASPALGGAESLGSLRSLSLAWSEHEGEIVAALLENPSVSNLRRLELSRRWAQLELRIAQGADGMHPDLQVVIDS